MFWFQVVIEAVLLSDLDMKATSLFIQKFLEEEELEHITSKNDKQMSKTPKKHEYTPIIQTLCKIL